MCPIYTNRYSIFLIDFRIWEKLTTFVLKIKIDYLKDFDQSINIILHSGHIHELYSLFLTPSFIRVWHLGH